MQLCLKFIMRIVLSHHVVSGLQFGEKPDLECDKLSPWCKECKIQVESENKRNLNEISRLFKLRVAGGICGLACAKKKILDFGFPLWRDCLFCQYKALRKFSNL